MTDQTMTLVMDSLPGLLLLGGFAFILATIYLWSVSRKPTRFAALRYRMIRDRIPQISLVILLLIGIFLVVLAVTQPVLLLLIVPIVLVVFVSTVVLYSALTWIEGVQWSSRSDENTLMPSAEEDTQRQSAPLPHSAESHASP
jgi:protein-S-isoprenylcysteine O-methyltransferase Ste14